MVFCLYRIRVMILYYPVTVYSTVGNAGLFFLESGRGGTVILSREGGINMIISIMHLKICRGQYLASFISLKIETNPWQPPVYRRSEVLKLFKTLLYKPMENAKNLKFELFFFHYYYSLFLWSKCILTSLRLTIIAFEQELASI